MKNLTEKKCIPCEGGSKPLSSEEAQGLLKSLTAWRVTETGKKIEKKFEFRDFKSALGFINEVGDIAEFEGHHPDIFLHNWNKVTITLSTHAVNGLSMNDFILAAKIDEIIAEES